MTNLRELLVQNNKKYRKIQGLSQEALAEKAGTSTTHIGAVVFLPSYNKSIERMYQDIMGDFEEFRKTVTGRIKQLQGE